MMMRIISVLSLVILAGTYSATGQVRREYFRSLYIDVNGNAGLMSEKINAIPFSTNYPEAIRNTYQGALTFKKAYSLGYNVAVGYYFDKKRHFGVSTGVNWYSQYGRLGMDSFHVEFKKPTQNEDGYFRQIISTNHKISEFIQMKSLSIPLSLLYKFAYNDDLTISISAGILYNLSAKSSYHTDANFDYEALYQLSPTNAPLYDSNLVPSSTDFLVTRAGYNDFLEKHPGEKSLKEFFKFEDSVGVARGSVGLNESPAHKRGNVGFKSGSLGYTGEVAANYRLMKNIYLRGGFYYTYQSFKNTMGNNAQVLTDSKIQGKHGQDLGVNYNSLLSQVGKIGGHNYGITIGIRVYLNRTAWKYMEPTMDRITPEGPKAK